jgi:hypothetical protein
MQHSWLLRMKQLNDLAHGRCSCLSHAPSGTLTDHSSHLRANFRQHLRTRGGYKATCVRGNSRPAPCVGAANEQSGPLVGGAPGHLGLKWPRVKGLETVPPVNVRLNDRVSLEQDGHGEAAIRLANQANCVIPAGQATAPRKR